MDTVPERGLAFTHVGGFAAEQEVVARRREKIDYLGVFAEPCFVLRACWNDHDIAAHTDSLLIAEAELILPLSIHTICSLG